MTAPAFSPRAPLTLLSEQLSRTSVTCTHTLSSGFCFSLRFWFRIWVYNRAHHPDWVPFGCRSHYGYRGLPPKKPGFIAPLSEWKSPLPFPDPFLTVSIGVLYGCFDLGIRRGRGMPYFPPIASVIPGEYLPVLSGDPLNPWRGAARSFLDTNCLNLLLAFS